MFYKVAITYETVEKDGKKSTKRGYAYAATPDEMLRWLKANLRVEKDGVVVAIVAIGEEA